MADKITNILICGVGGQGVITAAELLAQAAISLGFDVKKTEVAGMAQRGGVVTSHIRFGKKVLSPGIKQGEADILLAFEAAEGLRWYNHLKPGGVMLVNHLQLIPPVVSTGLFKYPENPIEQIRASGINLYDLDAGGIADSLGSVKLANTVMLGAVSGFLPFAAQILKVEMLKRFGSKKPDMAEANEKAFMAGVNAVNPKVAA